MIDPTCETLVLLTRAAFPSRPHIATRWRWALHGVRGVKLETVICGGQRFTSEQAVQRFMHRLNEPDALPPEPPSAAAERAGDTLVAMGA